jgi:hypothetical protein
VCLGPAEQARFASELTAAGADLASTRMFKTFKTAFDRIDVSKSEAGKDEELAMILAAVERTPGGCDRLNEIAKGRLEEWVMEAIVTVLARKATSGEVKGFVRAGVAGAAGMAGLTVAEEAKAVKKEAVQAVDAAVDAALDAALDAARRSIGGLLSPR